MSFRIGIILNNSHELKTLIRKKFCNLSRLSGTYFHNTVSADFKVSTAFTGQAARSAIHSAGGNGTGSH